MIAECYLHIGTEKTGTTSIQGFLALNREPLRRQGVLYPVAPGEASHSALAAYALQRTSISRKVRGKATDPADVGRFRDKLLAKLDEETDALGYNKLIFSNEHLSSRVRKPENVRNVRELCDRYAESTKIVIYLRNQVDFLVSSYGTVVKGGGSRTFPFPLTERRRNAMDYDAMISPWSEAFGRENVIVRRFETQDFVDGDLLVDFAATILLDIGELDRDRPRNAALSARGLAFLRQLNKRIPRFVDGSENPARRNVIGALARICTGAPLTVPADVAETIMNDFSQSNGKIAAEYFGGRFDPLFSPPRYVGETDVESQLSLDLDEALDIAAKLWTDQQAKSVRSGSRRKRHGLVQAEEEHR